MLPDHLSLRCRWIFGVRASKGDKRIDVIRIEAGGDHLPNLAQRP
jgi:hypothetical protein